ncbi:MAG: TM0106 family RecB-like putative nuclease [Planctomycetota bacterium]
MRRITGTTVYTYAACPRAAELDLHEDRSKRRPLTAAEELVRQRGRELEAMRTADLGYAEPGFERGEWDEGARQTQSFLQEGVAGVMQAVLLDGDWLGVPDLLRKEAGASALGDFHYVVGDVKSSSMARADQALQVAFYGRLLARVQDRPPSYGFLWLKDGREQRLPLAELDPVLDDVLDRLVALARGKADIERPFLSSSCGRCHWSTACAATLVASEDLSLLDGMTRGLRSALAAVGVRRVSDLASAGVERLCRRAHLESALVRRLQLSARAFAAGEVLPVPDAAETARIESSAACVHVLVDTFAERLLCVGASWCQSGRARRVVRVPATPAQAWDAFQEVVAAVPASASLLHWGGALPSWFRLASHAHLGDVDLHGRLVDVSRRLRGVVAFPRAVFGLRDAVGAGLQRDPDRAGEAEAAPLWVEMADGRERLLAKMEQDLDDLEALVARHLLPAAAAAPQAESPGCASVDMGGV